MALPKSQRNRSSPPDEMLVERFSRLALPKGAKPKCELCGQPAEYKCTACAAWFCTKSHFNLAWEGVLHLVHRELSILQEEANLIGSERERQELEKRRKQLAKFVLERSTAAAQTWVVQGNFGLAVAGAIYAARMAEKLYGVDTMEVVPSQLLLAEIYLGLHHLPSAEELLIMVNFQIGKHLNELFEERRGHGYPQCTKGSRNLIKRLRSTEAADRGLAKYPDASLSTRCNLYRNFGRLYASQAKYDQALRACATDYEVNTKDEVREYFRKHRKIYIYFAACEFGPTDFRTVPSFFNMAEVFKKSGAPQAHFARTALYAKICEIVMGWFEQLACNYSNLASGGQRRNDGEEETRARQHPYSAFAHCCNFIVHAACSSEFKDSDEEHASQADLEMKEVTEIMRRIVEYSAEEQYTGSRLRGMALSAMGLIYAHARDFNKALTSMQNAIETCAAVTGKDHPLPRKYQAYAELIDTMQKRFSSTHAEAAQSQLSRGGLEQSTKPTVRWRH